MFYKFYNFCTGNNIKVGVSLLVIFYREQNRSRDAIFFNGNYDRSLLLKTNSRLGIFAVDHAERHSVNDREVKLIISNCRNDNSITGMRCRLHSTRV